MSSVDNWVKVLAVATTLFGALGVSRWGQFDARTHRVKDLAETRNILHKAGAPTAKWDRIIEDAMRDVPGHAEYRRLRAARLSALSAVGGSTLSAIVAIWAPVVDPNKTGLRDPFTWGAVVLLVVSMVSLFHSTVRMMQFRDAPGYLD